MDAFGIMGICLFAAITIGVVLIVRLWQRENARKSARRRFFVEFDPADLRMCPYRLGRVYHLVTSQPDGSDVMIIWDAGQPVSHSNVRCVPSDGLIPFDPNRFS